jgi:hypothetical protein
MHQDIDWDNKRTNVDSSKKRAVMQHMDYDGFAQMVLGAHLKPIKKDAANNIYNVHMTEGNINHHATYSKITVND